MKSKSIILWAVALGLLISSCHPAPTASPVPVASPAVNPSAELQVTPTAVSKKKPRAVVIALDGARPDWTSRYMQDGTMPNLAALSQRGVTAAYLQTIDPALQSTAYLSLSTSAFPSQTGLVSDKLPVAQNIFQTYSDPLTQLPTVPEPIWRTAMRHGLKTAVLFWPIATPDRPDLRADYMVLTVESNIPAALHAVSLHEASDWKAAPPSFSPLQEGVLSIRSGEGSTVAAFYILAIDNLDDATVNYDELLLDDDKDLTNGYEKIHFGKWAAAIVSPRLHSGAYFHFTAATAVTAAVYQSRICYTQAYPADLLQALNTQFGFPPPPPDGEALQAGWLTPKQYYEMVERRAKWMMDVVLYVYQTYHPDLVLTMQEAIAQCARPFLLVDEQQKDYTVEKAALYASYLQKAHALVDGNLKRLLALVNLTDSAIFVLSAYGMMPVHTTVYLNTILRNAKLLQVKSAPTGDKVDQSKSKAWAWASGGSAHVYINLQGRELLGTVAPEDYEKVQEEIALALEGVQDGNGQPVFSRIVKQQDLSTIHLEATYSGDVFVQAAPGFYLSDKLDKKVLVPSSHYADTGFDATLEEMHGIFLAAGNSIAFGKAIPFVHLLDVAPTIAQALKLQPASTMAGHVVEGIWR